MYVGPSGKISSLLSNHYYSAHDHENPGILGGGTKPGNAKPLSFHHSTGSVGYSISVAQQKEMEDFDETQNLRYHALRGHGRTHDEAAKGALDSNAPKLGQSNGEKLANQWLGKYMQPNPNTGRSVLIFPKTLPQELRVTLAKIPEADLRGMVNEQYLSMGISVENTLKSILRERRSNGHSVSRPVNPSGTTMGNRGIKDIIDGLVIELKDQAARRQAAQSSISRDADGRGVGSGAGKAPKQRSAPKKNGVTERYIRTPEGARKYNGNIGDKIGKAKIKKGETLSQLAKEYYGDASKWKLIAEASGIKDETKIPVGTELIFPPDPDAKDSDTTSSSTAKKKKRTAKEKDDDEKLTRAQRAKADRNTYSDSDAISLDATYYVQKGEDLEKIAERYYGKNAAKMVKEIMKANGLKSPKDIGEGQALILPKLDPDDVYDDDKEKESQRKKQSQAVMRKAPAKSRGGGTRKQSTNGYVYYTDGAVYGPNGWVQMAKKKDGKRKSGSGTSPNRGGKDKTSQQASRKTPASKKKAPPKKRASAAGSAPGRNSVA